MTSSQPNDMTRVFSPSKERKKQNNYDYTLKLSQNRQNESCGERLLQETGKNPSFENIFRNEVVWVTSLVRLKHAVIVKGNDPIKNNIVLLYSTTNYRAKNTSAKSCTTSLP